jgi:hypothetical protein
MLRNNLVALSDKVCVHKRASTILLATVNTCTVITRFAWAGGTFFQVVLLCCVSFWFWREKGFDLHTHVLLRVQYSCGGVLVIWFWREIVFGVTHTLSVQYSCAVVSAFWL